MKIITGRLVLRDIVMKDVKDIVENANDILISRYVTHVPYPYTLKDGKDFVKHCNEKAKEKPRKTYEFGIELKSEKKIVGMITLSSVDKFNGTATIGYWLGRKYWRNGIMSEALNSILDFAFNRLKLRRMDISASTKNKASNGLIRKFGFEKEGMRRKKLRAKSTGKIHDENIYGLLKEDWKKK